MQKNIVQTDKAPSPIGPYNQAIMAGGFLFISGQIAMPDETAATSDTDITSETAQIMKQLGNILQEAGLEFENVVKTTIFLDDMSLFEKVNQEYGKYFKENFPARETVAVKGLPKNVNVEISMIAAS